jgi:magnesium transporter
MLLAYDPSSRKLVPAAEPPVEGWIHALDPTPEEQRVLREVLRVPASFLGHALDENEVARIDRIPDGERLVVVRVPRVHDRGRDAPYRSTAVGVVLIDHTVVTIARRASDVVDMVAAREDLDLARHARFVLLLVLCAAERFLAHLHDIDRAVGTLEDELQQSLRNKEVYKLLAYQKGLVHFTTALGSNRLMLERFQKDPAFAVVGEDHELLEDVLVELHQASEMTGISVNILGEMMDAFASIISNNLNVVMKVLTSLTIVLTIPTMIASFFGMNVDLPLQKHPLAFPLTILLSLAASTTVAVIFFRKRWL